MTSDLDNVLTSARAALAEIRLRWENCGGNVTDPDPDITEPAEDLADAFETLDEQAKAGHLPTAWMRKEDRITVLFAELRKRRESGRS